MRRLNRKVEYALMALKVMGSKSALDRTSASEVAEKVGAPFDATARVLQIMAQNGVLKSEHGAQGGYRIAVDLNQVTYFQLIEMILGPLQLAKCLEGSHHCELSQRCNIQTPVTSLNERMARFYKTVFVGELLGLDRSQLMQVSL